MYDIYHNTLNRLHYAYDAEHDKGTVDSDRRPAMNKECRLRDKVASHELCGSDRILISIFQRLPTGAITLYGFPA